MISKVEAHQNMKHKMLFFFIKISFKYFFRYFSFSHFEFEIEGNSSARCSNFKFVSFKKKKPNSGIVKS